MPTEGAQGGVDRARMLCTMCICSEIRFESQEGLSWDSFSGMVRVWSFCSREQVVFIYVCDPYKVFQKATHNLENTT